tara:strand:- start:2398 stop:3372 length:975 start_codon:yes stop_codon:yes gene_type:complete
MEGSKLLPVTLITGFLGSGKTTLLNYIIENQVGIKIAVLVNEFGEIGIDNELIIKTSDDVIELTNGCICCSINGELVDAVNKVLSLPNRVDYLIVETTGLAEPLPIASTFLSTELREMTRLDSIVTLIDAENFKEEVLTSNIARSQIIYGDILLLNKCDLVDEITLKSIEQDLIQIKSSSKIIRSVKGKVPLPLLISTGLFQSDSFAKNHNNCNHDHGICEHDEHHKHNEIEEFSSISFVTDKPFSLRKFQDFLDNKLADNVFRAKGILWFEESIRKYIFHLAGKRISLNDFEWESPKTNKIVIIGKHLDKENIKKQLEECKVN